MTTTATAAPRRKGRKGRLFRALMVPVALLGVLIVQVNIADAVHDLEFQLEGNTADDAGASADFDWESFFDGSGPGGTGAANPALPDASRPGFTASGFQADFTLPDQTTFATGSKDTLNISPGWQCKKSNNVGDKVDIVNAYSAVYTVPSGPDAGDNILYFGVETSSPNGNSNVAVWFLQDGSVDCSSSGGGNQSFTGNHQDGDLLVVSAFTNGGTVANVAAYEWEGGADGFLNETPVATGGNCKTASSGDDACAVANDTASVNPPWAHPDKDGGALNPNEFFEGGVNLTDAGLLDACFARFLANTRSSQSLTATIFDFAAGELETCAPSTNLTLASSVSTVKAGGSATVTITEANDGINPLLAPDPTNTANGGYVTVTSSTGATCTPTHKDTNGGASLPINDGDTNSNGVLDPGESWVFTCELSGLTATTTLTVTGHGIDPLGRDVTFTGAGCTDTATRLCDPDELKTVTITVVNPSTELTKKASITVTYTYEEKNDGDVELVKPAAGWVTDDNCSPVNEDLKPATTVNVGDTDNDGKLDPGETFKFTCTKAATTAGTDVNVTNRAIGSGLVASLNGAPVTFCPEGVTAGTQAGKICVRNEADEVEVKVTHKDHPQQPA